MPYENTTNDWNYLCMAGKYARHLGLIDPTAFVDRRNPEPHIFRPNDENIDENSGFCGWDFSFPAWQLPTIDVNLTGGLDWELPNIFPVGYEYSENLQPYHLEIWIEKSTMDDVLIPLCKRLSVNLVTSVGFMSITSVIELLERVCSSAKPCRIFYISDFDPAGNGMLTAVARQIEYYLESYAPGADIKLNPIVLTAEQVQKYRLPRIPIKESDRRKDNFEQVYGTGAVELDAMEALYPGKLAHIVIENIMQFRDKELFGKVSKAKQEAWDKLKISQKRTIKPYQKNLNELKQK